MPIFDQGYQHWKGTLTSHAWRWLTITQYGVRAQLRNPLVWLVMLAAWVPAIGLWVILVFWGLLEQKSDFIQPVVNLLNLSPELRDGARGFRVPVWTITYQFFFQFEMFFAMILVMLVGPNLISQDLRFNAMPLYLSRPLRRVDYFAGKLGVIGCFLGAVVIVPAAVAYVLGVLFSLDPGVFADTYHLLLAILVYGAVTVLSAGTLMLALSSLSRRSLYVGAMWIGIWFVSWLMSVVLSAIQEAAVMQDFYQREAEMAQVDPAGPGNQMHFRWDPQFRKRMLEVRLSMQRDNWRHLLSYVNDLDRIGQALLGTETAWRKMASLGPPDMGDEIVLAMGVPQYPWYWSAAVLAGLAGLSVWILSFRVKSLDRLR
jgi:ABC-2 type transport system permease protein